jgi:hypothetical protein
VDSKHFLSVWIILSMLLIYSRKRKVSRPIADHNFIEKKRMIMAYALYCTVSTNSLTRYMRRGQLKKMPSPRKIVVHELMSPVQDGRWAPRSIPVPRMQASAIPSAPRMRHTLTWRRVKISRVEYGVVITDRNFIQHNFSQTSVFQLELWWQARWRGNGGADNAPRFAWRNSEQCAREHGEIPVHSCATPLKPPHSTNACAILTF